jgi:hypothetical protein
MQRNYFLILLIIVLVTELYLQKVYQLLYRTEKMSKKQENNVKSPMRGVHPQKVNMSDLAAPSGNGMFPNFKNQGGPVINTPQVYILFVGDWTSPANQNRATRLRQFTSDLLNSQYMNILSQYGCGTSGTVVNSVFVDNSNHDLSGLDINNILQTAINNNQIPEPTNPSNAYMLFLDDATAVNDPAAGHVMCEPTSDTAFGFHWSFTTKAGNECAFAVVPSLIDSCLQKTCPGGDDSCSIPLTLNQEQRQTQVASHELAEMFSDPLVNRNPAWYDKDDPDPGDPRREAAENGDICNGLSGTITVGSNSWAVQLMYSKVHDVQTNGVTHCIVGAQNPLQRPA